MNSNSNAKWSLVGRDVWIVVAIIIGLLAIAPATSVQLLQIPGYLLMVGYDLIQNPYFPGVSGWAFWALYAVYIYVLAIVLVNGYYLISRKVRS